MGLIPSQEELDQFQQGFGIVVFRILSSASTKFAENRGKIGILLFVGIIIIPIAIYIITIPVRIILYSWQVIMSFLSLYIPAFSKLATMFMRARLSITIWSIFFEAFWYIPLFILFISRTLGLFSSTPFEQVVMDKNVAFGTMLFKSENKQTQLNPAINLIAKTTQLLLTTTVLFVLRLNPAIRLFISLSILGHQLYRKLFAVNYHLQKASMFLIGFAFLILFSDLMAKILLFIGKIYLSSVTLSREFMFGYFCKVTAKEEKQDQKKYEWLLFGFGIATSICFGIPIFGLLLYPSFQKAAADVLIAMLNEQDLSFINSQSL